MKRNGERMPPGPLQPALDAINAEAFRRQQDPTLADFEIRPGLDAVGAWVTATFANGSTATGYAPYGMASLRPPTLTAIDGGRP